MYSCRVIMEVQDGESMDRFTSLTAASIKLLFAAVILYFAASSIRLKPAQLIDYFQHAGSLFSSLCCYSRYSYSAGPYMDRNSE